MNACDQHRANQAGQKSGFDPGPTPADIDADLADVSIATLERYARDLDLAQFQAKPWEALPIEQRKAIRAGNELAKRQHAKERADRQAAEDARGEAQQQARIDAKIADYRAQMRGAFPGNDAQFDAAWPRILEQWQIDQARAQLDATMAQHRARLTDF
jgi:hypothetical protein